MAHLSTSLAGWCRLPKTLSVSLTEAVTATHDFRVTSYSLLDGVGVGKHVSSSIFSAGDCHWILRFYPDGRKENGSAPYASVFLHLVWAATDVRVKYSLSLLQKDGSSMLPVKCSATDIFKAPSDNRGYRNFVTKSWLKNQSCLDNDCLTIRCVLTVIKGSHIEDVDMDLVDSHVWSIFKIARPISAAFWRCHGLVTEFVARGLTKFKRAPGLQSGGDFAKVLAAYETDGKLGRILANQKLFFFFGEANQKLVTLKPTRPSAFLHQHLEDLLKNGEGADVKFTVDGQLFCAHKCVLAARSPVFKAELLGPMKEGTARCIQIDDMQPAIFEALLRFIYTDCLPEKRKFYEAAAMQHLLVATDRYGVDMLKFICETRLAETIDVDSVAATLALAEQYSCSQLRRACIGFVASPDMLGAIMRTDGFRHLVASCPSVMEQILEQVSRVWVEHSR
ncbi:unnamed protein product [Alopecurus aequalis]